MWLRFEYDEAGRQVKVKDDLNNVIETYTYGASRNRLVNETTAGRTYYAWGGSSPLVEYFEATASSTPAWEKSYIYAGSRLLSTSTNLNGSELLQFHHPDRTGTGLISTPGADTYEQHSTLPFGTFLNTETTTSTNQTFTSYDRSATTGLDYAINRTFSPGQGRFTQVDPIDADAISLDNPQSNNLFAYVQNHPVDYVDPSGLLAREAVLCIPILRSDGEGDFWYEYDCFEILVGGGGYYDPWGPEEIETEVRNRLKKGDCKSKLEALLKALGKDIKNKKNQTEGFEAHLDNLFGNGKVYTGIGAYSAYKPSQKRIYMNVDPTRGQGITRLGEVLGTEFIHEALHALSGDGLSHESIVKGIARVEGIDFNALKNSQMNLKGKNANDSSLFEAPMNAWINKYCGEDRNKLWDNYYAKFK